MTRCFPKRPRIRLDPGIYDELRRQVLARDGWRCQLCGKAAELHVHHIERKSSLGDDIGTNLITLCARCHGNLHEHPSQDL
jgi:5-methylcytosine-specific restriction endonuclease McrA